MLHASVLAALVVATLLAPAAAAAPPLEPPYDIRDALNPPPPMTHGPCETGCGGSTIEAICIILYICDG